MVDDPAQAVAVRLASPEVYSGAGIAMPPVLASLNLSVMKRDGRQFLHVTSLRPVEGDHLHLYLELADKGQRTVRLATLWLTADPDPAPAAPALVLPAAPAAAPTAARPPAAPSPAKAHAAAKTAALAPAPPPPPLPIHAPESTAPAACAHQAEQARVCAALDGKNAALKQQLGALEGKVKSLQATLGAAPAPAAAPEAAHEASGPKPIGAIGPLVPRKPKAPAPAPEPAAGLPWGWIGAAAALLLAMGGVLLLLRRRVRTVRNVGIPAAPRLAERLRQRFAADTNAAVPAAGAAVEPSVD
ncbi:MAG: FimV/HubP-related protein, partial [Ramlibacter sp.]